MAKQIEIVNLLNCVLNKEKQIKEYCLSLLEGIKKSIRFRAFRGELGTNNPEEESSIELLKSIL
jgi:type I restriction enzyme S subunit